jgi:glycosyltransferase involved in cell wall biosynthesis
LFWNDWIAYRNFKAFEQFERELAAQIDRGGYDLVLASTLRWAYAPALPKYLRTPCLYYCHEPPRRFYEPWCRPEAGPLSLYERMRLAWHAPVQRVLDSIVKEEDIRRVRAATKVLTNSHYSQGVMGEIYRRAVHVSYLGVEEGHFRPPEGQQSDPVVLSVGRYEAHKGFDFLIEALSRIPQQGRPNLILVGSGGNPQMTMHLEKMAWKMGVSLELHQGMSDAELADLYRSAGVFAFGARLEPFGLVVLEAMASGLPVVAVAEGGVPEMITDGQSGYLTMRDPDAFAHALMEVLSSPHRRMQMGKVARAEVESHWTWKHAAERFEAHLQDIVQRETQREVEP